MGCGASTDTSNVKDMKAVNLKDESNARESPDNRLQEEIRRLRSDIESRVPKASLDTAQTELQSALEELNIQRKQCEALQEEITRVNAVLTCQTETTASQETAEIELRSLLPTTADKASKNQVGLAESSNSRQDSSCQAEIVVTDASSQIELFIGNANFQKEGFCQTEMSVDHTSNASIMLLSESLKATFDTAKILSEVRHECEALTTSILVIPHQWAESNQPHKYCEANMSGDMQVQSRQSEQNRATASQIAKDADKGDGNAFDEEIGDCNAFDEDQDEEEVIQRFFQTILRVQESERENGGSRNKISVNDLDSALLATNHSLADQKAFYHALHQHLTSEINRTGCAAIDLPTFRSAVTKFPQRVCAQRVEWARSLSLDRVLAKHLKVGTLYDGLEGLKAMSDQDLSLACAQFSAAARRIVLREATLLRSSAAIAAATSGDSGNGGGGNAAGGDASTPAAAANGKYLQTAGAYTGSFATLDDFLAGPEKRIGFPNPNLMQGIRNEHLGRPNAGSMFVTANYGIATTPAWEYLFVADPSSPELPQDLQVRFGAREGRFPGEVGDTRIQLSVRCTIKSVNGADTAGLTAALERESSRLGKGDLLHTEEEVARGISVLPGENGDMRLVLPLKAADFEAERREALVRWAGAALGGADMKVVKVAEERFVYVEYVDEGALRAAASKMSDSELMELALAQGNGDSSGQTRPLAEVADRDELMSQAVERIRVESERMGQKGLIRVQGRRRMSRNDEFMHIDRVKRKMEQAKLIEAEVIALRLYTGPMYVLYNAVLRRWPKPTFESLLGNHYETTISVISSGITKLSRITRVPSNRLLYRGLGGMLLPEQFWRESGQGFLGGVEMGLMSTTSDKSVAIHYSGHSKKRAIIFEIAAGRVDVGASIGFLSQYPGEKEFLMQPLSCLEVMGRPRLERTAVGEVIVFPIRVNVNLKGLIVEELIERRKRLHLSMASNLQEELAQQIRSELECKMISTLGADELTSMHGMDVHLSSLSEAEAIESKVKQEYQAIINAHEELPATEFNDETEFKRLIMEIIDAKVYAVEKIKVYLRFQNAVQRGEEDRAILERVLSAALKDYAEPYVELGLRTGVDDFPWHDFMARKPAIDLGLWSPVSKEEWKLEKIREVLAKIYAEGDNVRLVTIKGKALQFPKGLLSSEAVFNNQNICDVLEELCFMLSVHQSLTSLSLRSNELRAHEWATALDRLTRCVELRTVCGITFHKSLFQGSLANIELKGKRLDDDSTAALCGLLPRSTSTLTQLDLGINTIGDVGATAIAETLPALPALKTLILCENKIGDSGLGALAMGLTCLRQLQLVNLDTNPFSPSALIALSSAVSDGVTLGCVSLAEQNAFVQKYFKKADAAALEAVLRTDIDLNGASIGAQGARALSGFLRRPAVARTVTTLNIYANDIGDEGAKSIAAALPYLTELRELSMRHNKITSAGAVAVAAAIPYLPKLTYLGLNGNSLDDGVMALIKEKCRLHCPALTKLLLERERRG